MFVPRSASVHHCAMPSSEGSAGVLLKRSVRLLKPAAVMRLVSVLTSIALGLGCVVRSNLPARVTEASVRQVVPGMTPDQVRAILGDPVGVKDTSFQGAGPFVHQLTYVYFRRLPDPWYRYPMLWVHFQGGVVNSVYAKRHSFWDSEGVYGIDPTRKWERPEFGRWFRPARGEP